MNDFAQRLNFETEAQGSSEMTSCAFSYFESNLQLNSSDKLGLA